MSTFTLKNIFSVACREKCMTQLRSLTPVPTGSKVPENSSVLMIPLCRVDGVPALLYTVRSSNYRTNTGLITFPGGNIQRNETAVQTALREVKEDLGLSTDKIGIWGQGPGFPSSNNSTMIIPIIGVIPELRASDLNINMNKVVEAFTIPLELLCDPRNQYYTHFKTGEILPVFMTDNYKICGMTAHMTHVFLSCTLPKEVYGNEWLRTKLENRVQTKET